MANRYSNITTSQFDPMSFQEVMFAPSLQRKKHDELDAQRALLSQGLGTVNPHDKYFNEANTVKADIENQILSQSEQLAREGVNSNSQADFLKLNNTYQKLMSPTGKLGMINSHNVNLKQTYADYLKESIAAGNSPNVAKQHAQLALQQHMKDPLYDDRGRVVDFKIDKSAVKYIDIPKRVQEYATATGINSEEMSRSFGALSYDKDTNRYVMNSNRKNLTESNLINLQSVMNLMNREVLDPNHEVGQSIDYTFKNPASVLEDIKTQLGIYTKTKTIDDRGSSIGSVDWADRGGDPELASLGLTVASENFTPTKYSEMSVTDISSRIDKLSNQKSLSESEKKELGELTTYNKELQNKINSNPEFKKINEQILKYEQDIQDVQSGNYKGESMFINGKNFEFGKGPFQTSEQSQNAKRQVKSLELNKKIGQLKDQLNEKAKEYTKNTNLQSTDYMLTPQTAKQVTTLKIASDNIEKLFKNNPQNVLSMVNIESLFNGDSSFDKLTPADKDVIAKVMYNAKPGSITLERVGRKGALSGKPEYVLRVQPNKDNNGKVYEGNNIWSKGSIGEDKPFDIRVSFKKSDNGIVNNVNGLIKEYVGMAGDKGKQLSKDMSLYQNYGNEKWSDFKKDPVVLSRVDALIQKDIENNKNSVYSKMGSYDQMVEHFMNVHRNELINFDNN